MEHAVVMILNKKGQVSESLSVGCFLLGNKDICMCVPGQKTCIPCLLACLLSVREKGTQEKCEGP